MFFPPEMIADLIGRLRRREITVPSARIVVEEHCRRLLEKLISHFAIVDEQELAGLRKLMAEEQRLQLLILRTILGPRDARHAQSPS